MKILYVTNYVSIAKASGGFISDYMNDLLFYGLYELFGTDVVDSTPIISLYKENQNTINPKALWGGMTSFWLIDKDLVDRTDIRSKIESHYYDIVIYGACNRCLDYIDLVQKVYKPQEILFIDGADDTDIRLFPKSLYFKRELIEQSTNVQPISFAIPTCKLSGLKVVKTQSYGTVIPGQKDTYIFKTEVDYYQDYQKSYYGVTKKKAGWDALRHYEILGNSCIPFFDKLENCPKHTLTTLPKEMLLSARDLAYKFDPNMYYDLLQALYQYTEEHLTTKALATRIINYL